MLYSETFDTSLTVSPILFIVTDTIPFVCFRNILNFSDELHCAEICKFAKKAVIRAKQTARLRALFPQGTLIELRYNKIAVFCVFLFVQYAAPPLQSVFLIDLKSRYYSSVIIIKKLPIEGSLAQIAVFWHRLLLYFKLRLILAVKIPSSAEKSYIPSYLFVVVITERMPTP